MNLFVKNLDHSINAFYLEVMFKAYGEVESTKVVYDRATGEHRGIGFVEMAKEEEGLKAIEALNGKEINGRPMVVEKAKPKKVNIWS
jgi:RNA recognition motif-containing protein